VEEAQRHPETCKHRFGVDRANIYTLLGASRAAARDIAKITWDRFVSCTIIENVVDCVLPTFVHKRRMLGLGPPSTATSRQKIALYRWRESSTSAASSRKRQVACTRHNENPTRDLFVLKPKAQRKHDVPASVWDSICRLEAAHLRRSASERSSGPHARDHTNGPSRRHKDEPPHPSTRMAQLQNLSKSTARSSM